MECLRIAPSLVVKHRALVSDAHGLECPSLCTCWQCPGLPPWASVSSFIKAHDNPHFEGLLAEPNGLIHLKYLARETHSTVAVLIQDKPFARNFVIRGSKALDKISGSQLSEDQGTQRDIKF